MKIRRHDLLAAVASFLFMANSAMVCRADDRRESTFDAPHGDNKFVHALTNFRPGRSQFEKQYDDIWVLVQRYFLYQGRLANWSKWRHRFDGHLATANSFEKAVVEMLESLHDPYTFYRNYDATAQRDAEDRETHVVDYRMLNHSIGYVRLKTFCSTHCVDEMRTALSQLRGARGVIFDLRDNRGGSIEDAFRIFSMFVPAGQFASMKGIEDRLPITEKLFVKTTALVDRRGRVGDVRVRETAVCTGKPVLVLVNSGTKSAAEMLAGALRDNDRATLIGTKTFGKGVVQRVWQFNNFTSIKITSAAFILPAGATIHGVGIKPGITVLASGKKDRQLYYAKSLLNTKIKPAIASRRAMPMLIARTRV